MSFSADAPGEIEDNLSRVERIVDSAGLKISKSATNLSAVGSREFSWIWIIAIILIFGITTPFVGGPFFILALPLGLGYYFSRKRSTFSVTFSPGTESESRLTVSGTGNKGGKLLRSVWDRWGDFPIEEKNQLEFAKKDDPEPEKYVTGYASKFLSIGREKGYGVCRTNKRLIGIKWEDLSEETESELQKPFGGISKSVQDLDKVKGFEIFLQDIRQVSAKEHPSVGIGGYFQISPGTGDDQKINIAVLSLDPVHYNRLRAVLKDFLQGVPPMLE